jgi:hypothetical protein
MMVFAGGGLPMYSTQSAGRSHAPAVPSAE